MGEGKGETSRFIYFKELAHVIVGASKYEILREGWKLRISMLQH